MRLFSSAIHIPQFSHNTFVGTVNFFLTPCIICSALVHYYVACYLFQEVIVLQKHYGPRLRILHSCTDQAITGALEQMDLTAAQSHIMGYLACHPEAPCSRDIEEAFQLSHPTVSGLLARLEKKGFIEFRPDNQDRRIKRIYVLPKGKECQATIRQNILDMEHQLVNGFSPEEQILFLDFLERAIANMGGAPWHYHHKEEHKE